MASIALKGSEQMLILGTRQGLILPFTAPSWTDLRLSLWLSLTKPAADDDNTSLTEATLTYINAADQIWIGFKNNSNDTLPSVAGSKFAGLAHNSTNSTLSASGTTSWITDTETRGYEWEGASNLAFSSGASLALPGTGLNASTYAQLLIIKLTRPNSSSLAVTAVISGDTANRTATPTIASARSLSRTVASTWSAGAGTFTTVVPDAIFVYWPYFNSRLRIHAFVLEKFA